MTRARIVLLYLGALLLFWISDPGLALAQSDFQLSALQDPVTGRSIIRYQSPQHETHHYYFISPWSPDEKRINFFQFAPAVDKLTARGRFPGALWLMDADGKNRQKLVDGLQGHYHVGVNQFWGPNGKFVYYLDNSAERKCMARVDVASGEVECIDTPVPCLRASPDLKTLSCGTANEWGVYGVREKKYTRLVTLERALALTPNKSLASGRESQLQNTRFSPTGDKVIIVHRTKEDFPRLVEIFVYDFKSEQLVYLTHDLHHPTWRPDGKAILFVRWDDESKTQALWEVDVETKQERPAFNSRHVPAGHPSYHPLKQHLVVTDCYGGEFGNGLAILNLQTGEAKQLVTIPLGSKPESPADDRFPFRNWGIWIPPRKYLNEPRPVWNKDGTKVFYTSEESGRMNLYVVDTSDL
jgi:Tol biopolymer transport system component